MTDRKRIRHDIELVRARKDYSYACQGCELEDDTIAAAAVLLVGPSWSKDELALCRECLVRLRDAVTFACANLEVLRVR